MIGYFGFIRIRFKSEMGVCIWLLYQFDKLIGRALRRKMRRRAASIISRSMEEFLGDGLTSPNDFRVNHAANGNEWVNLSHGESTWSESAPVTDASFASQECAQFRAHEFVFPLVRFRLARADVEKLLVEN